MSASFCGICGAPLATGRDAGPHASCEARRELEPPRFCASCGRRMVVQVTPAGWSARCSRHGEIRAGR